MCLGRVRPHGFRNIIAGVLGTVENGRLVMETQEHGVIYPVVPRRTLGRSQHRVSECVL